MPRYDVRCEDQHVNEVSFTNFKEADEAFNEGVNCPDCGKPVQRLITTAGKVIYKCGGFYGSVPTDLAHNTGLI